MILRVRYRRVGGHVRCSVYIAPAPDQTFALTGELTFRNEEWPQVREKLERAAEVVLAGRREIR